MPRRDLDIHYEEDGDFDEDALLGDSGIHVSHDGQRAIAGLLNVRAQKRRRVAPTSLDDDYAGWTPVPDTDWDEVQAVADTLSSYDVTPEDDNNDGKRKRYLSSDEPMRLWRPHMQTFLEACIRREGLGDSLFDPACACCGVPHGEGRRLFRCSECGEFLQCADCVKSRHAVTPLHIIKEWDGEAWMEATLTGVEPNAAGLTGVGLVYQLGHHGFPCRFPKPKRRMIVIDTGGVFTLEVQSCGCEKSRGANNLAELMDNAWYPASVTDPETCATFRVLEYFRLLNVVGNVNVHDFVGVVERLTDPLRLGSVPDRYKAFGRMSRQFGFLQRAKRAGRGHVANGLPTTPPGGLAVDCWPCPHDGRNLPDGWKDVDPKYRFLYMLLLALDANFRLKNRLRANEHQDPTLGAGMGYFVEPEGYKRHLRHYVAEKDVSSCIAFAALLQKETRLTTGLRTSGVGGCVCARHGVVRPQGLGDLQKGERYANMDYIFLSAIMGACILLLAISYDIACQWKIHLRERATKIKATTPVTTDLDQFEIQFALPVWHAQAHEITCQTQNSLSFAVGVGRTDGEGIERTWAVLNPIGFATKEMGEGARHDAIENKVDYLNFEKNIGQGNTLARKLIVAIAERDRQVDEFREVDRSLSKKVRGDWEKRISEWLADPARPNPYCLEGGKSAGPSEAAVLRELKAAETLEAAEGRAPLTDTKMTLSSFIKAGLQLEESQRRIKAELKGLTLVTADRSSQIQELRLSLFKKIRTYERLQTIYMPGVAALREAEDERRDPELPAPKAEDIKLWMPSDLTAGERRSAARRGAAEAEAKLRHGQCKDALDNLRSRLHAQTHLISYRNANAVGQRASTRSASLIGRVGDRIARVASKYRDARKALIALKGEDFAPEYQDLKAEDITVSHEQESDAAARKKLGRLGSGRKSRNEPSATKKTKMSWIWVVGGGPGEDDAAVHDSVRVEWSKARARRDRWVEEVDLLREEMKRVLRMLRTIQHEWRARGLVRIDVDAVLAGGLKAYAMRQVKVHRRIAQGFHAIWSRSVATAVREVVRQDGTVYRELLDGQTMDSAPAPNLEEVEEQIEREGNASAGGGTEDAEGGTVAAEGRRRSTRRARAEEE